MEAWDDSVCLSLCPYHAALVTVWFVLSCEIGNCESYFVLFQDGFGSSGCLPVPWKFYYQLVNFYRESGRILIEISLNLYVSLMSYHLNNAKSSHL